jgi:hypothetical protein
VPISSQGEKNVATRAVSIELVEFTNAMKNLSVSFMELGKKHADVGVPIGCPLIHLPGFAQHADSTN